MKAVSFELSGKTACFRKPDVNQYAYFTYNNIHKPALLGLFGAILGLGGYTQLYNENREKKDNKKPLNSGYPEFYERLKDLKVSITPIALYGYFSKKIQAFNNSVGYASREMGGNLIVREQWLEKPKWQIMVLDDGSEEYVKLKEYLLDGRCEFIPYLGKNDHPAKIDDTKEIELSKKLFDIDGEYYIDSLFIKPSSGLGYHRESDDMPFLFQEVSPIALQKDYHFYKYETLIFTNHEPRELPKESYSYEKRNYTFI